MKEQKRLEQLKEAARKYCEDAAFGTDRQSMPELAPQFIDGAKWADENPNWKDGMTDYPADEKPILVRAKIVQGQKAVYINAIGKHVCENGECFYRLGDGMKAMPKDFEFFYWMPMPKLPWYYENQF